MQKIKVVTASAGEVEWPASHGYSYDFARNGDLVILRGEEVVSLILAQDILSFEEV